MNPQTERGKIGHFHIYLSVRSRAVCGEREREEGRKTGGRAATTGTQRAHKPSSVFSISHTHIWLHGHREKANSERRKRVCLRV